MPLVSNGYVLDIGLGEEDTSFNLLFEKGQPLMCTLTHVDMAKNINKFTVIHALHSSNGYLLYSRSGRTGQNGRISFKNFSTPEECVKNFKTLFKSLTANVWEFRDRFEHRMGYHAVFSYGEKTPDFVEEKILPIITEPVKSNLDERLEYLIELLCGNNTTSKAIELMDIDYAKVNSGICCADIDYDKMPVGMITQRNIQNAKLILQDIKSNLQDLTPEKINRFSERYYAIIPLKSSRGHPPKLDNIEIIDNNLNHLEDLSNITLTLEIIEKAKSDIISSPKIQETINEKLYKSMNHVIIPLNKDNIMYHKICKFISNSHGKNHHFSLNPQMIFEVLNSEQKRKYDKNHGNSTRKEMLVHGSRLCNWRSILEKGLLLNPLKTGAVITGKMFGNGIYWANSFSKSAQYCGMDGYKSRNNKEMLCLAIAEVAVGKQLGCLKSEFHSSSTISSTNHNSVWGIGQNTPSKYYDHNGVHIPTGYLTKVNNTSQLLYDEKIIFDESQYYFRYLVIVERN